MLEQVTAVRFDRRMGSGKTWPCLLSCLRSSSEDDELEIITKFSGGCERKVGGLVAEAIAAMLASDLDLPIPEPVLVEFDTEFVDLIKRHDPALGERIGRSVPRLSVQPSCRQVLRCYHAASQCRKPRVQKPPRYLPSTP